MRTSRRAAVATLLLCAGLAGLRPIRGINAWVMTHWTFTYEHGFLKRALLGDVVARVSGPPSAGMITAASAGVALVLAIALVRWFAEPAIRVGSSGLWLFALVAATHSATIPNFVYDAGRFDQVGLLILLGCILLVLRGSAATRLVLIPAACGIGLLVHEAFAVMFLPLIMVVWYGEETGKRRRAVLACLAVMIVLTWAIGSYGRMTAVPLEQFTAQLQDRHNFTIRSSSVLVLYTDFRRDFTVSLPALVRRWQVLNHSIIAMLLLPTFILLWRVFRAIAEPGKCGTGDWRARAVLLAACSPLVLYSAGVDVARWWALAITNCFIALTYLAVRRDVGRKLGEAVDQMPYLAAAVAATSLVAGPIGIMQAYPLFEGLWSVAYPMFDSLWSGADSQSRP